MTRFLRLYSLAFLVFFVACQKNAGTGKDESNWMINLYDSFGEEVGEAIPDWGYSAFIRYNGQTILFDGGSSAQILEHNAKVFGVDLKEVDIAIISHSHGDHTIGIDYLININPSVRLFVPNDWSFGYSGSERDKKYRRGYRFQNDNYEIIDKDFEIAKGINLIHTTSSLTGIFWKYPPYEDEPGYFYLTELSLALTNESGDVTIITGCSHSGVEAIVKETRDSLNVNVALVTGGFHLLPYTSEYITDLAHTMKDELGVRQAAPTHCTGNDAIEIFKEIYMQDYLMGGLGAKIIFPR